MSYRIHTDRVEIMMRQCVDLAVHNAVARFERELSEGPEAARSAAHHIARAAATVAIEQLVAYCNSELAMIKADHEFREEMAKLRPPQFVAIPRLSLKDGPPVERLK